MSIVFFSVGELGQVGEVPRRNKLVVTDSLATLTTPGYLNNTNTSGKQIFPTDIFDVLYDYSALGNFKNKSGYGTGTYTPCTVAITNGVITLSAWSSSSGGNINSVTYRPNGTPSGTVFTSFGLMCTYLATLNQDQYITIFVDTTGGFATIAAGTYTLPPFVEFIGIDNGDYPFLITQPDVIINGVKKLKFNNCGIDSGNITNPIFNINNNFFELFMFNQGGFTPNTATNKPVLNCTGLFECNMYLYGTTTINSNTGPAVVLDALSTSNLQLFMFDGSQINANAITLTSPNTQLIFPVDSAYVDASYMPYTAGYTALTEVTYAPNGFNDGQKVFTNWANLVAAINQYGNNRDFLYTIYFDSGNGTNRISIPAGTYSMPTCCKFQGLTQPQNSSGYDQVILSLSADVIFSQMTELTLENISLSVNNTTNPVISISNSIFNLFLSDASSIFNAFSTGPGFINASSGSTLEVYLSDSSELVSTGASSPVITFADSDTLGNSNILCFDFSIIGANALSLFAPTSALIEISAESLVDSSYSASTSFKAKSSQVNYTPATSANWPTVPTIVNGALDTLASENPVVGSGMSLVLGLSHTYNSTTQTIIGAGSVTFLSSGSLKKLAYANTTTLDISSTGLNKLDTGTVASNTTYYIWAIGGSGQTPGFVYSLSHSAPTYPTNYTFGYIVRVIQTESGSSNIRQFYSTGIGNQIVYTWNSGDSALTLVNASTATSGTPSLSGVVPVSGGTYSAIDVQVRGLFQSSSSWNTPSTEGLFIAVNGSIASYYMGDVAAQGPTQYIDGYFRIPTPPSASGAISWFTTSNGTTHTSIYVIGFAIQV